MEQKQEKRQALMEHLAALRNMLIISVAAVLVAFVVIFLSAADPLLEFIEQPLIQRGIEVQLNAHEAGVMSKMKVCLIAAVVVACPIIIWQVWRFISPALYAHEKRTFWCIVLVSILLFVIGVVFCYCVVYLLTLDFFISMSEGLGRYMPTLNSHIDNLFGFVVPFGLAFELPVALYLTTRMGLTNYQMLASKRKYIILAVAIIAAILTPPDVVSQIMLIIPILVLFEISLLVVRCVKPRRAEEAEA